MSVVRRSLFDIRAFDRNLVTPDSSIHALLTFAFCFVFQVSNLPYHTREDIVGPDESRSAAG